MKLTLMLALLLPVLTLSGCQNPSAVQSNTDCRLSFGDFQVELPGAGKDSYLKLSEPAMGSHSLYALVMPDRTTDGNTAFTRYYDDSDGSPAVLGETYGIPEEPFYTCDVTGDGIDDLIVNTASSADGIASIVVYAPQPDGTIRKGWASGFVCVKDGVLMTNSGEKLTPGICEWTPFMTLDADGSLRGVLTTPQGDVLTDGAGVPVSSLYHDILDLGDTLFPRFYEDGRYGYLDLSTGQPLTSHTFVQATAFENQNGYARVMMDDSKWALLSRRGDIVADGFEKINELPSIYSTASAVRNGKAVLIDLQTSSTDSVTVRELSGAYPDISEVHFDRYTIVTGTDGLLGIVNIQGQTLVEPVYQTIEEAICYSSDASLCTLVVQNNGLYGLVQVTEEGRLNTLVPCREKDVQQLFLS